jgi:predicted transcriptional regulator
LNTRGTNRTDLTVLERIHRAGVSRKRRLHQRDLAAAVGLSLGMTNAILKRLAQKGWLSIRKVNNRNIQYIVTPSGITQITRRSVMYLKRTIRNIVDYRDVLDLFIEGVRRDGYDSIALVGRSDLEFVIEYLCQRKGMAYARVDEEAERPDSWYLYGEDTRLPPDGKRRPGIASLKIILAGVPGRFSTRDRSPRTPAAAARGRVGG